MCGRTVLTLVNACPTSGVFTLVMASTFSAINGNLFDDVKEWSGLVFDAHYNWASG